MKEKELINNNGVVTTQDQKEETSKNWVFIPLSKKNVIKRTDTYILFNVDGVASGIVSAKFLRKKESEDMLFLSMPANYEVNCQVREKIEGKWTPTKKYVITAEELRPLVLLNNKEVSRPVASEELPF